MRKKLAIVDPSSRTLPYDFHYIEQVSKEFDVVFYCSKTQFNGDFISLIRALPNVEVKEFNVSNRGRVMGLISYLGLLLSIISNVRKYKYVHFQWSIAFTLELPLFFIIKNKLCFTFHNKVPHHYEKMTFWPFKIISRLSRLVFFVSETVAEEFIKDYKLTSTEKVKVVPHGVMSLNEDNSVLLHKSPNLEKELIFWGNVKPYKGVELFEFIPQNIPRSIYGKWDNKLKGLKERLLKSGVEVVDKYLTVDEILNVIERNGIFVLPYLKASQSGVLYTLLNYGCVFISSRVGDSASVLKKGGLEGLLFTYGDVHELIDAVEYCHSHYDEIKNKLHTLKIEYSWANIIKNGTYEFGSK
ncbi:glycosyltransferase [Fulvivirga ligni]|uniref:glycosyltransferase n=1 Tax=Fulvivirga ligni TaxID=2904246 RepID=UPI001F160D27|nr:glycosyltransferase [Fulvivirga ligni]UII22665.1 glycosyltransferase [Fulvivirga ligni]